MLIIHLGISWLFLLNGALQGFHFWVIKYKIQLVLKVLQGVILLLRSLLKISGREKESFISEGNCVVIQQDIFTNNIVKVTLEVHVLKLAMNKQRFACRFVIDFTLRGMHHDKSKRSLT